MRKTNFFKNFGNILLYAILGTLIAIIVTGAIIYGLSDAGVIEADFTITQARRRPAGRTTPALSRTHTPHLVHIKRKRPANPCCICRYLVPRSLTYSLVYLRLTGTGAPSRPVKCVKYMHMHTRLYRQEHGFMQ